MYDHLNQCLPKNIVGRIISHNRVLGRMNNAGLQHWERERERERERESGWAGILLMDVSGTFNPTGKDSAVPTQNLLQLSAV